jgi:hypothetical protein
MYLLGVIFHQNRSGLDWIHIYITESNETMEIYAKNNNSLRFLA